VLGRACGISPVTLWKWRTGRGAVDVDTIARACDRLARKVIFPGALAGEAANLMAGIPWRGKKTASKLLRYAMACGLSAHSLFHLARRQERLNVTQYARSLGIPIGLLSRISAPPDCDWRHDVCRESPRLDALARRFGLQNAGDIADFKRMVRHGSAVPRPTHEKLVLAFRDGAENEPRAVFLRGFLALLKERYSLRGYGELADAVIERITPSGALGEGEAIRLERRFSSMTKPTHSCVRLLPSWAAGMAAVAFPGERELGLRRALIRYLVNAEGRRKGERR